MELKSVKLCRTYKGQTQGQPHGIDVCFNDGKILFITGAELEVFHRSGEYHTPKKLCPPIELFWRAQEIAKENIHLAEIYNRTH